MNIRTGSVVIVWAATVRHGDRPGALGHHALKRAQFGMRPTSPGRRYSLSVTLGGLGGLR
jgi:hypothetical protein